MKKQLKENQDNLATLMADQTRVRSERSSAQHEHSTLNQEKQTLEGGTRRSETVSYTHLTLPTSDLV